MASETAKAVAQDVINARKKGGKIVLGEIMEKRGYKKATIKNPKNVTETQSYREEIKPFLQRLVGLRDKVATELERKDITDERFTELAKTLKDLNHDIQLLSGGSTDNLKIKVIEIEPEIAEKYGISPSPEENSTG